MSHTLLKATLQELIHTCTHILRHTHFDPSTPCPCAHPALPQQSRRQITVGPAVASPNRPSSGADPSEPRHSDVKISWQHLKRHQGKGDRQPRALLFISNGTPTQTRERGYLSHIHGGWGGGALLWPRTHIKSCKNIFLAEHGPIMKTWLFIFFVKCLLPTCTRRAKNDN